MDERRRGMMCVTIGCGMLAAFVWFESQPTASKASHGGGDRLTVLETLKRAESLEGIRLRYSGRGEIVSIYGRPAVFWDVEVYHLPRDSDGLMPVVVHVDKHHPEMVAGRADEFQRGDSVVVCFLDQQGRIVRTMKSPGAAPPEIDPLAFVMTLSQVEQAGDVSLIEGTDRSYWQLQPGNPSTSDEAVLHVTTHSVAQRLEQIERRMRLRYDRASGMMVQLELFEEGHWRRKKGKEWSEIELVGSSRIPASRIAAISQDLMVWEEVDSWIGQLASRLSESSTWPSEDSQRTMTQAALLQTQCDRGATFAADQAAEQDPRLELEQLPDRIVAWYEALADPVMRRGLTSGMLALHSGRTHLTGVQSSADELCARGPVEWSSTDLTGTTHTSAQYQGRPVIIAFLCRGTPHATETISTLVEVRRRFSEEELAVVAFATTFSRESAEAISLAIGPSVPMFHDSGFTERMNQFKIGRPTILLVDGEGRIRHVRVWNPVDPVDDICAHVEQLRSTPDAGSGGLEPMMLAAP